MVLIDGRKINYKETTDAPTDFPNWAIIGIVLGIILVLLFIMGLIIYIYKKNSYRKDKYYFKKHEGMNVSFSNKAKKNEMNFLNSNSKSKFEFNSKSKFDKTFFSGELELTNKEFGSSGKLKNKDSIKFNNFQEDEVAKNYWDSNNKIKKS